MRAFQTSAMPPVAILSRRTYWPNLMPSAGSSSSAGAAGGAAACGKTGCDTTTFSCGGGKVSFSVMYFPLGGCCGAGGGVAERGGCGVGAGCEVVGRGTAVLPAIVAALPGLRVPESVSLRSLSRSEVLWVRFGSAGAAGGGAGIGCATVLADCGGAGGGC